MLNHFLLFIPGEGAAFIIGATRSFPISFWFGDRHYCLEWNCWNSKTKGLVFIRIRKFFLLKGMMISFR